MLRAVAPSFHRQAFKEIKTLVGKSKGKRIADVMTPKPLCVTPDTTLNDAAKILLTKKIRRLPVVDAKGKLVGILSRGNIVRAALEARQEAASKELQP